MGIERGTAFITLLQRYVSIEVVSPTANRAKPTVFKVTVYVSFASERVVVANGRITLKTALLCSDGLIASESAACCSRCSI